MIFPIALGLLMQVSKPLPDAFVPTPSVPALNETSIFSVSIYDLGDKTFTFSSKEYDITISMDGDTMKIHFTKKKAK
jgi:hypothetical protein